ncbi:phage adsorption protein NrfB [Ruminococcaceae bacterium OttesenSCG-928-I18]|nr:phage adsorption protein NrfB [Ruminococcaceae bacterium OttesenSCG-928-I18]
MTFESVLYIIGLVLVSLYLLTGFDDFIWDIITLFRRKRYRRQRLDPHQLDTVPPKLLAVAIAAWHEDNVLGAVIENVIASVHYPKSMYHIFLGVYPNDDATMAVAAELEAKFPNVHRVVNELPGPTSKAQNINYVIRQIRDFEQEHGWQFASLTIHDSEDVIHSYELKVTNYLLEKYEAMQFPVFPILPMPRFRNFFKTITTGTYADEFAENHFSTMVSRYNSGAFVPSAGTGFALSRATIESFGDEDVLPRDSLTEDYRLSLTLFERGIQMYYVLERVPRITNDNKLKWDFIATRSIFPNTFKTATKQKTRWILGITMQSFKFRDIFQTKGLRLVGRYSLYKDLKAKVGNLLVFVGYPVLIYFLVSLFVPLPVIYPIYSVSWYLCVVVTIMMIERQLFRGVSIYNVYGMRSVFFACLFPPIIPLRLVWGNIINMVATFKAYKQKILGQNTNKKANKKAEKQAAKGNAAKAPAKKKLAWDKTEHTFLEKSVLKRYHRNMGDVLLEKGFVTPEQLAEALREAAKKEQPIGSYLLGEGLITEEQLLLALSHVKHIQFLTSSDLVCYHPQQFASVFDEALLRSLLSIPVMKTPTGYVIAFCESSPNDAQTTLRNAYGITVSAVFASRTAIENGLEVMYSPQKEPVSPSLAVTLALQNAINYEQAIIVHNYADTQEEETLLQYMGLQPHKKG